MTTFLLVLQIMSAIAMIGFVLLHSAKGEGLAGIGGEARLFGSARGLEEGLDRITSVCAGFFIGVSIVLFLITT